MHPKNIRNYGDLMKYWSSLKGRTWINVTEEDKEHVRVMDKGTSLLQTMRAQITYP